MYSAAPAALVVLAPNSDASCSEEQLREAMACGVRESKTMRDLWFLRSIEKTVTVAKTLVGSEFKDPRIKRREL